MHKNSSVEELMISNTNKKEKKSFKNAKLNIIKNKGMAKDATKNVNNANRKYCVLHENNSRHRLSRSLDQHIKKTN
jgi:hypothetical protein